MTDTAAEDSSTVEKETAGITLLKRYAEDPDGREILRRFARSIEVANEFGSKHWVPTFRWGTVTLRIGTTQAIILSTDDVEILVARESLTDETRAVIKEAALGEESFALGTRYKLTWTKARELWESLEEAHHGALRQGPPSGTRNPEAKALVGFLNRELALELPNPRQPESANGGGLPSVPLLEAYSDSHEGRAILRATAKSIEVANAESRTNWGTTANKNGTYVALNVGNACAIRLHADRVRILLLPDRLDAEARKALEDRATRSWPRAAIPGAQNYEVDWPTAAQMWESLQDAHHAILTAARRGRTSFHRSHSNTVIDFLNRTLELNLPYPDYGEVEPPSISDPNGGWYSALLQRLDEDGLLFSPEAIANYILALQTKRFAILTGISGTGKTQIARAVARSFQARIRTRRAADPDAAAVAEDAFKMTARPYHFNHKQLILPVAFVAEIDRFLTSEGNSNGGPISVSYPGGRTQLRFWKDPKPDRSGTWLLFAGAHDFRDWYLSNLQPDDHFYISPREGNRPGDHWLEFSLPEMEQTEHDLDHYKVVPVRPDWVDNRGLLGHLNPITGKYSVTPFLQLLLDAQAEVERAGEDRVPHPFFVVLDEMNLARVEHYFSDFLSALESGEPIPLHESEEVEEGGTEAESGSVVPRQLRVPDNVFFTGTVNVDETTYMFSPKVLDRAFTIEFDRVDLNGYTDGSAPQESGGLDLGAGEALALKPYEKLRRAEWVEFCKLDGERYGKVLQKLHAVLEEEHRHFGYRVANEIARFVNLAHEQWSGDEEAVKAAFDLALLQKVLPKFHGTQQELEPVLRRLFHFAVDGEDGSHGEADVSLTDWRVAHGRLKSVRRPKSAPAGSIAAGTPEAGVDEPAIGGDGETEGSATTADADSAATEANAKVGAGSESRDPEFPRTAAKIWRMLRRLEQRGFAAFIE